MRLGTVGPGKVRVDPFAAKLALSFVVGGLWIAGVSVIAERYGSKLGGFIGGIPSTAMLAMLFIGWTGGPGQVFQATTIFPLAFSINSAFFMIYVLLARKGVVLGLIGATLTWLLLQSLLLLSGIDSFLLSFGIWVVVLGAAYRFLARGLGIRSRSSVKVQYNALQLLWRALFAGLMIAFAVVMARIGGPILGGIFSTFPANNISTLFITSRAVDVDFSKAIVPPLMISAGINCVAFIAALRYGSLLLGFLPAFLLALGVSALSGFLIYQILMPKMA